jgi:hypothetical protein
LAWATAACCSLFGLIRAINHMVCLILIAVGAQRPVVESLTSHCGSCSTSEVIHKSLLWGGAGSQAAVLLSALGPHYVRIRAAVASGLMASRLYTGVTVRCPRLTVGLLLAYLVARSWSRYLFDRFTNLNGSLSVAHIQAVVEPARVQV